VASNSGLVRSGRGDVAKKALLIRCKFHVSWVYPDVAFKKMELKMWFIKKGS
jgi:hypothetical protein